MQSLRQATFPRVSADRCARELLASAPAVMRFIRDHMRAQGNGQLTVPQFRVLVFLSHEADASLSTLAAHLGLSLPAASRLVDGLVQRGLTRRRARRSDRRCVVLSLTGRGQAAFRAALRSTQEALAGRFDALGARERSMFSEAMRILSRAFAPESGGMGSVK